VENIPFQAERHSARRQKLFALPPEWRSLSQRNTVRIHNGMVFGFRPESRSSSTGFPTIHRDGACDGGDARCEERTPIHLH
jgi:hypothetical protein